jgi:electron transport complex protein RnfG
VAAIISTVAPQGYNGNIYLLVAIRYSGKLAGVRVVKHRETPGLGDAIDEKRSDWISSFDNKSLQNPAPKDWKVKRDGGVFDQFTGATITPRAVVDAVYKTLQYFEKHRDELFTKQEVKHATDH